MNYKLSLKEGEQKWAKGCDTSLVPPYNGITKTNEIIQSY